MLLHAGDAGAAADSALPRAALVLEVQSRSGNSDRPAVGVVGRVCHALPVQGEPEALGQVDVVIGLESPFGLVADPAVADESVDPAQVQVSDVRGGNPVLRVAEAHGV